MSSFRRSRWGGESAAGKLTGLNMAVTAPMTQEQLEAYVLHVRISEISQRLKMDDIVPADLRHRSPSPPPEYNAAGQRTNTRYRRHRERLLSEQNDLVQQAALVFPRYRAPTNYRFRPVTKTDKVYIPAKDFPEVNFVTQLLGPRGRSLVELNRLSGATIFIRGKGSVKEGSRRRTFHADDREPLHCLIEADSQAKIDKAKVLLREVIERAATVPDHENDRKRDQLRQLAISNGTFRDDEGRRENGDFGWGPRGVEIVCRVCSGVGHIARDCPDRKPGGVLGKALPPWRKQNMGSEAENALDVTYAQFLADING
ncbi:hypothetical protein OQA88_5647 [Cercophora sp. LCS_1]